MRLLLITGLPATGKTTLARQLAQRYGVALMSKDTIKEPMLDALGTGNAAHSRRLSNVSSALDPNQRPRPPVGEKADHSRAK